MVKSVG